MKKKKVLVSVIIFLIVCTMTCNVFAATTIWEQAVEWMRSGKQHNPTHTSVNYEFENLAGILTGAGIWIIIISGAIIGIRFMLASPDHKAELKKAITIYSIGSVIILGALVIWRVTISVLDLF